MSEFPQIKPHLVKEMDGILPRVSTYQHIATVLGKNGDFARAIEVCQDAINLGLHDGTKSDFEGRIKRLDKKKAKLENLAVVSPFSSKAIFLT